MRILLVLISILAPPATAQQALNPPPETVLIPGGSFVMGDAAGEPDEVPEQVTVKPFRLMRFEVTNDQFAAFIAATRHITDVERQGSGYVWTDKWRPVTGVSWKQPHAPDDSLAGRGNHPVVQVSQRDAAAWCRWAGMRLPSEAEWEFAARGSDGRRYPWGNQPPQQSKPFRANFGTVACCAPDRSDGYERTAPIGRYAQGISPFGIADMAGNVWEWTSTKHPGNPRWIAIRGGGWGNNPWCLRSAYRHGNPPDIGLDMVGFRCAADTR